mmetsp:Transcript_231/g.743  ORF Transcript_231/g.743 Transcript_231/m.743 type:complete len:140 (+) Transcript_231:3-422(+)
MPSAWCSDFLAGLLRACGLCMHCDVDVVCMDHPDQVRVRLKSGEAAARCLELDGRLLQHGDAERPLLVKPATQAPRLAAGPRGGPAPPPATGEPVTAKAAARKLLGAPADIDAFAQAFLELELGKLGTAASSPPSGGVR